MNFYLWTMRYAPIILFLLAILIITGTVVFNLFALKAILAAEPMYEDPMWSQQWAQIVMSLVNGFEFAAVPLLGAAVLWRADRWLANQGAAK
ncbi:MAG: hypothetical protein ACAH11_11855 [Sphingomonas sp.]